MTTSVTKFRNDFKQGVLDFAWHEWCRAGVPGSSKPGNTWIVDPEVLLAFTTEAGRHDARLFDEVLGWLAVNGDWINTGRLSAVMKHDGTGDRAVAGAMAAWMCERDSSLKWRGIARRSLGEAYSPEESLFQTVPAGTIPGRGQADKCFKAYGLLRGKVRISTRAQHINLNEAANIVFRTRALFGIGIRADVIAHLLCTQSGHARGIAEALGYNHMRVGEVLAGLAKGGFISVRAVGRAKSYRLDRKRWSSLTRIQGTSAVQWVNWRALVRGLTAIWRAGETIDGKRADDYIVSSKMRSAMRKARDDLRASGIEFDIHDDESYIAEAYLPVFLDDCAGIVGTLLSV
ncbi:MAG: hypothetical protein R6V03_04455 [Kiritimatiellia bacterium]